jgi:hypothetical protein
MVDLESASSTPDFTILAEMGVNVTVLNTIRVGGSVSTESERSDVTWWNFHPLFSSFAFEAAFLLDGESVQVIFSHRCDHSYNDIEIDRRGSFTSVKMRVRLDRRF